MSSSAAVSSSNMAEPESELAPTTEPAAGARSVADMGGNDESQEHQQEKEKDSDPSSSSSKRKSAKDEDDEVEGSAAKRTKVGDDNQEPKKTKPLSIESERWRAHQRAEDYMSCVGDLMLPGYQLEPFHSQHSNLERMTLLGYLTSKLRRPDIWETWSPYEIMIFEGCLQAYGKQFHIMARPQYLPHKTTKDIIAFYYVWKKTERYQKWKTEHAAEEQQLFMTTIASTTRKK